MTEPWILAVDLGTGGPKTGAVTLGGELLAVAHRHVPTTFTGDGGAVQDPHAWWQDALHRPASGDPGVDDSLLAHRQPLRQRDPVPPGIAATLRPGSGQASEAFADREHPRRPASHGRR
jgi:hypothetical protein